jgi:hypothetical protein
MRQNNNEGLLLCPWVLVFPACCLGAMTNVIRARQSSRLPWRFPQPALNVARETLCDIDAIKVGLGKNVRA